MFGKGLLKRLLPFFATFAFGLLIASFFVTVAAPKFRLDRGMRHRDYDRQMQCENQRLREENLRLRQQNGDTSVQQGVDFSGDINQLVPPPPPLPPAAPRYIR